MKIKDANVGALTNFEVIDFLLSRGALKDPTRVIVPITPSEFKVYYYLVESATCNQTKEHINEFLERCKNYKLAKAKVLNIINLRPSALVEIDPIIEQSSKPWSRAPPPSMVTFGRMQSHLIVATTSSFSLVPLHVRLETRSSCYELSKFYRYW